MNRVTCMGLTTLDVVQVVERLPGPDEKVVALDGWVAFGGPAANAAATSAALGAPTTLVSAVGRGPVADLARAGLADAGVRLVDLTPDAVDLLPVSTVVVRGVSRAVVSRNAGAAPDLSRQAARLDVGGPGDVLLVDGHHLGAAVAIARRARAAGVLVLLDGGSWKPGLERLIEHVDVAVLSADLVLPGQGRPVDEAQVDELLAAVAALGPSVVARSAGAGPVRVRETDGRVSVLQPPHVEEVADTLGAGDVLHGATAAALAGGAAPLAAVGSGVRRASESVLHRGALGWVATRG